MKWILNLVKSQRLIIAIGFLLLILLIWIAGDWFGLSVNARLVATLVVFIAWTVFLMIERARAQRGAAMLEQSIKAQADEQVMNVRPEKREEIENLKQQLAAAIESLKTSKLAKGRSGAAAMYALPWYMMIGPPAAGKTTAIKNSGLDFPFGNDREIQGIGGTRNCDWWFSNSAILLDTAGRYTTEADDREEWMAFLDMLKKYRRRQPINGVLVGISIQDIVEAGPVEIEGHAKKIRTRIDELIQRLGVRFPVYLVFTKCDLLNGFVEFFEDLSRLQREQVWGSTFSNDQQKTLNPKSTFEQEFDLLCHRLFDLRLTRLVGSMKREKRRRVYVFPLEFSSAKENLSLFVARLFQPNPYQESPTFRGFYFTSGTQEGVPIDRVIQQIADSFGLSPELVDQFNPEMETKAYFITDFLNEVVIPDQRLVGLTSRSERQRKIVRKVALAAAVVALAGLIVGVTNGYLGSKHTLNSLADVAQELKDVRLDSRDLRQHDLFQMEMMRKRIMDLEECADNAPVLSFGMSRCADGLQAARQLYFRKLNGFLQQFVVGETESRLRSACGSSTIPRDQSYSVLKSYLLLGNEQNQLYNSESEEADTSNRNFLERQLSQMVDAKLKLSGSGEDVRRLARLQIEFYVHALANNVAPFLQPDENLVQRARSCIYEPPSISTSYAHIKREAADVLPAIKASDILGGRYQDVLQSDFEIPGCFTRQGWETMVKEAIQRESENPSKDDWVMGTRQEQLPQEMRDSEAMEDALSSKYFQEYGDTWWSFLRSVHYVPFGNLSDAARKMIALGDPVESPLAELLRQVSQQTRFESAAPGMAEKAGGMISRLGQKLGIEKSQGGEQTLTRGIAVDKRFSGFHAFVEGEKNDLGRLLNQFAMVGEKLEKLGAEPENKTKEYAARTLQDQSELPGAMGEIGRAFNAAQLENPRAVRELFEQPIRYSWNAVLGKVQQYLNTQWQTEVFDAYQSTFASAYPFKKNTENEIPPEDLAKFFDLQQGTLGEFYTRELETFIKRNVWEPVMWEGQGIELSKQAKAMFDQANMLAKSGFSGGHNDVSFLLQARPPNTKSLKDHPPVIDKISMKIDDKDFKYEMGSPRWEDVVWPGQSSPGASLKVYSGDDLLKEWTYAGYWGLFKLLSAAEVSKRSMSEYEYRWRFNADNRYEIIVKYTVKTKSAVSLLTPGFFDIACPPNLN